MLYICGAKCPVNRFYENVDYTSFVWDDLKQQQMFYLFYKMSIWKNKTEKKEEEEATEQRRRVQEEQ